MGGIHLPPAKNVFAINPAIGGKKNVLASRMSVNLQPNIANSIGSRLNAHNDQPVRNATIVPVDAPERRSAVAMGKLT